MKLIFGLGNPGNEYQNTRHNIGYMLLDYINSGKSVSFQKRKFNALIEEDNCNGEKILYIKPLSFMNLSGEVVRDFVNFYKVSLDDILVIHDDLDMNFGRIKFVFNSSSGGHNGIKDIEKRLGSSKYVRLKIGISNDKMLDTKDYVLSKFSNDEMKKLNEVFFKLSDVISDFCNFNLDKLMNKYNGK